MTERGTDDVRAEARLEAALGALGAELAAPLGWQARVLAAAPRPPLWRRWWSSRGLLSGALAAAAAVVLVLVWRPWDPAGAPRGEGEAPQLAVLVDHQGRVTRGQTASVGSVLRITARSGPGHRAIWIFRDRELLAACPGGPRCTEVEGALAAELPVEIVGAYTVVALWSARPIGAPAGARDEALAAAERSGAVLRAESIAVN